MATIQARTTMKPLSSFEQSQIDKVTQEIDRYQHLVDTEKKQIASLEHTISNLREQIYKHRREIGDTNSSRNMKRNSEKQIQILENRLDQSTAKFNRSLADNKRLRDEIDSLRGERKTFEGVYKKLEKVRTMMMLCL